MEYEERHFQGFITIEKSFPVTGFTGDIGVQIAEDGRIWVCIDGAAFIRFKPFRQEGDPKWIKNDGK